MGQASELLGVSADTLRRWADAGRLPTTRTSSGQRLIDGAELALFAASLAGEETTSFTTTQSTRNHFLGLVTKVVKDKVMAQVELQAGPHRVVSLISREAVDNLGLTPGVLAVASIKATNVAIELPDGGARE